MSEEQQRIASLAIIIILFVALGILFIALAADSLTTLILLVIGLLSFGYCLIKSPALRASTRATIDSLSRIITTTIKVIQERRRLAREKAAAEVKAAKRSSRKVKPPHKPDTRSAI